MNFKNLLYTTLHRVHGKFTKKTVIFFGISLSYDKPLMSDVIDEFATKFHRQNANLVFMLYNILLKNASARELFCLRNNKGCFIFNNKVLDFGYKNFYDIILNCYFTKYDTLELSKLDEESILYKEHITRLQNNEFFWKYRDLGLIQHQFLSYDENGYYINDAIIDGKTIYDAQDGCYFQAKNSRRPFYNGTMLGEYLEDKDYDEQLAILIKLAEYIFSTYSLENNMIDGKLYDCYEMNFIYDKQGNFHFIDDNYVSKKPLTKQYVLTKISERNNCLTNDLFIHFGYSPLRLKRKPAIIDKAELLRKKYFSS